MTSCGLALGMRTPRGVAVRVPFEERRLVIYYQRRKIISTFVISRPGTNRVCQAVG